MKIEKIIYFAENHDYFEDVGDEKWNIFNGGLKGTEICLSPYKKSKIQSDILTILHVNYNNKAEASIDIFWEPGAILSKGHKDMNDFNNVLKWKADYTKNWIQTELLPEAYRFWNDKNLKKDSIVKKKILQLMGRIKFRY
ncbi:MAG: hypothetical protein IJZ96_10990 [Lachnospiraceae bacterium]|nr:hypothetical protein [Lachnospiraceae bacterium]